MKFNVGDRVDFLNCGGVPNGTPGTIKSIDLTMLPARYTVLWDDGYNDSWGPLWKERDLGFDTESYADKILEALNA